MMISHRIRTASGGLSINRNRERQGNLPWSAFAGQGIFYSACIGRADHEALRKKTSPHSTPSAGSFFLLVQQHHHDRVAA